MLLPHTLRLAAVPAAGSHRAQVTEHPPSVSSSPVLAEPPPAGIVLCCGAGALQLLAGWLQAMLSLVLQGHSRETGGASAPRAQAGRAGDGLAGSSPLLFPKQPARRCHTRARGCTRKPSHSPCGKEAPATTCEYCRGLCAPFPSHQELGPAPQCGSGEGRVSRRLPRALASCCRVPSASEATSGSGQGVTRCQPCLPAQLRAASVPRGVEG